MIVARFKVKCRPEKTQEALVLFRDVVTASRPLEGVVNFDMGRDITDSNAFIATEVFKDRAALDRQESLPQVKKVMGLFDQLLASPPEWTIFEASPAES
ncbi:MAG: antibiotic biosynthesis monooxygenase [Chloroflexi bacterium]|nr:antibiotic biosynthesis monooxygenase [Chloroflexota bacterium]